MVLTASSCAHGRRVQESQTRPTPFGLVRRRQPYKLVFPSRHLLQRSGEQRGNRTRPTTVRVWSCHIELLIRDLRPVGSVSQIGGQYPLCAFSADIILTYNDRTERTTFNYCTLYTCLQSFWHCREIPLLLVLLFVPSFCILRNAE